MKPQRNLHECLEILIRNPDENPQNETLKKQRKPLECLEILVRNHGKQPLSETLNETSMNA